MYCYILTIIIIIIIILYSLYNQFSFTSVYSLYYRYPKMSVYNYATGLKCCSPYSVAFHYIRPPSYDMKCLYRAIYSKQFRNN